MKNSPLIAFLALIVSFTAYTQKNSPKNVLLIIVDDLRPALPTYGATQVVAPNITSFSKDAVQFNNAFVNIPTCGASRASILTGIRPTRKYFKTATSLSVVRVVIAELTLSES